MRRPSSNPVASARPSPAPSRQRGGGDGVVVGEDADDAGAGLDLLIDLLE